MKNTRSLYWVAASLMSAFMLLGAIPDLLQSPQAVAIFGHLGYPTYLLPFLGVAKTLGIIAVLVPLAPRLTEWAFAGFFFDVIGALYSHLAVGDGPSGWLPPIIGLVLVGCAYLTFRMRASTGELSRTSQAGSGPDVRAA